MLKLLCTFAPDFEIVSFNNKHHDHKSGNLIEILSSICGNRFYSKTLTLERSKVQFFSKKVCGWIQLPATSMEK